MIALRSRLYNTELGRWWRLGKNRIQRLTYAGDRVECPCCGAHYREFLPLYYPVFRSNVKCLKCDCRERHRMLWLFLRDELKIFETPIRLLHIGPEAAFRKRFRQASNIDYISADLVSPLADMKLDLTRLPFKDGSFDAILCVHVLDYIPNDLKAMTEMRRVLKPGGWAIVQIPLDPSREQTEEDPTLTDPIEQLKRFNLEGHVRVYGRDYLNRLRSAGFQPAVIPYTEQLGSEKTNRYVLPLDEPIYLCR